MPAELRLEDWSHVLRVALGLDEQKRGRLVILDEFPYLLRGAPELPSTIQAGYDDVRNDPPRPRPGLCCVARRSRS